MYYDVDFSAGDDSNFQRLLLAAWWYVLRSTCTIFIKSSWKTTHTTSAGRSEEV